jgi:hypothetical protein
LSTVESQQPPWSFITVDSVIPFAWWIDLGNCNPKLTSLIAIETFHMMKVFIKMQHMDIASHFILFMFDKRF